MSTTVIPKGFVPFFYLTGDDEDVLRGSELQNGMIVCLQDQIVREDPDLLNQEEELKNERTLQRIHVTSRWCRVTKYETEGNIISFIGEYADGSKFSRTYARSYAWMVKK